MQLCFTKPTFCSIFLHQKASEILIICWCVSTYFMKKKLLTALNWHQNITTQQQNMSHLGSMGGKILLHQTAKEEYWTKYIISDSLLHQITVIMPIKHILYINNNGQLKWVLCQGALVTQRAMKHTPWSCGIVRSTAAIARFTKASQMVRRSSSRQLEQLLTRRLKMCLVHRLHLCSVRTRFLLCLLNYWGECPDSRRRN